MTYCLAPKFSTEDMSATFTMFCPVFYAFVKKLFEIQMDSYLVSGYGFPTKPKLAPLIGVGKYDKTQKIGFSKTDQ